MEDFSVCRGAYRGPVQCTEVRTYRRKGNLQVQCWSCCPLETKKEGPENCFGRVKAAAPTVDTWIYF